MYYSLIKSYFMVVPPFFEVDGYEGIQEEVTRIFDASICFQTSLNPDDLKVYRKNLDISTLGLDIDGDAAADDENDVTKTKKTREILMKRLGHCQSGGVGSNDDLYNSRAGTTIDIPETIESDDEDRSPNEGTWPMSSLH